MPAQLEIVRDPRYRDHAAPAGHPERPERLDAVEAALDARRGEWSALPPRSATPDELLAIHDRSHVEGLQRVAGRSGNLDADTYVSPASIEVAELAAGGCIDLALRIATGQVARGFAAVRPPGHHAEGDRAMGFCLFNNAALAARAVQREAGVERVLLLDWDVHHGNGSQHSFESDPSVLYLSTHQYPFYPGTGSAAEQGVGRGEGATLNLPMPAGCGDPEYIGLFQRVVVPAARFFRPDFCIVSCGFDAHADDPLASMQLTRGRLRRPRAPACASSPTSWPGAACSSCSEGGYSLLGLREGTDAVLDAAAGRAGGAAGDCSRSPPAACSSA